MSVQCIVLSRRWVPPCVAKPYCVHLFSFTFQPPSMRSARAAWSLVRSEGLQVSRTSHLYCWLNSLQRVFWKHRPRHRSCCERFLFEGSRHRRRTLHFWVRLRYSAQSVEVETQRSEVTLHSGAANAQRAGALGSFTLFHTDMSMICVLPV